MNERILGSLSPDLSPPTPRVLLIQAEWPARALLKAELENRGFDVLAAQDVETAIEVSLSRGFRPNAVVLDVVGAVLSSDQVQRFNFLRGQAPLLLLTSNQVVEKVLTNLLPDEVLARPFSIGNVGDAVLRLT